MSNFRDKVELCHLIVAVDVGDNDDNVRQTFRLSARECGRLRVIFPPYPLAAAILGAMAQGPGRQMGDGQAARRPTVAGAACKN